MGESPELLSISDSVMVTRQALNLKSLGPKPSPRTMKIRQELRESRQAKKKTKMLQHGKGLAVIYKDVVLKKT